jgi:hypothetical protein
MPLSDETLDVLDAYVRSMQISAWRGRPYAEYQRAFDIGAERIAANAASPDEADEIRLRLREMTDYEGDDVFVDAKGIITWEDRREQTDDPA